MIGWQLCGTDLSRAVYLRADESNKKKNIERKNITIDKRCIGHAVKPRISISFYLFCIMGRVCRPLRELAGIVERLEAVGPS